MGASSSSSASSGEDDKRLGKDIIKAVQAASTPRSFFLQPRYGFPLSDNERLHPERYLHRAASRDRYEAEEARRRANWMFVSMAELKANRPHLKKIVRRGIPAELRPQLWLELAAETPGKPAGAMPSREAFQALVEDRSTEYMDRSNRPAILKDVDRTFVAHPWFQDDSPNGGVEALRRCLLAFVHHEPETGYLSSMNQVVANALLFYADDERRAFWLFELLVSGVLPPDFYHKKLVGVQVAGQVFARLLQLKAPRLHRHLEQYSVQPRLLVVPWFTSLFVSVLPRETCMRVWDCLMLEGGKILFRVALAMFLLREEQLLTVHEQGPLYRAVSTMGASFHDPDELLGRAFDILNISRAGLEQMRRQWLEHVVREARDAGFDEATAAEAGGSASSLPSAPPQKDGEDGETVEAGEGKDE